MELSQKQRILLIDNEEGLCRLMEQVLLDSGYLARSYTSPIKAMEEFVPSNWDLVITDIQLPGMSGIELIREARKIKTGIKFIVLSMFEEQDLVKEAMDAGADAYIVKSSAPEQLIRALKKVSAGKKYLCEDLAYAFWNENNKKDQLKPVITEREKEVLRHILDEKSNKQIAECMFISERTVESHRKNLYRKTNSDTLVGLVKYAIDHKLT